MKRLLRSIRGRIFLWLLAFTSVLLIAVGLLLYHEAREIVLGSMDRTLHSKAQVITGLLHEEHDTIELELSEVVLGEYSIPRSGHYYKVLMDGKPLAISPSLVENGFDLGIPEPGDARMKERISTSVGPDGEPVRVLRQDLTAFGRSFVVFVAEDLSGSLSMISAFRNFLFLITGAGIIIVCLAGFRIAKLALGPLEVFSNNIREITHRNLGQRLDAGADAQELAVLAGSFNGMLDRLQKAFESERRLVADASHELKTPLSVIRAECDVTLQRDRRGQEYIDAIRTIRSVSEDMDSIVRDLLTLARLDAGVLSPTGFTHLLLCDCLDEAVDLLLPLAAERNIHLTMNAGSDITVEGDAERLTEAFLNIIENGIKYGREDGYVEISACGEGRKVIISVADSGRGIRQEDLERIYDRFFRSDSSRGSEGTGLGLSIAKTIVEAHGGEIRMESEWGKGSRCTVVLPGKCFPVKEPREGDTGE